MKKYFSYVLLLLSSSSFGAGFLTPDNAATVAWINVELSKVRVGVAHNERLNPDDCGNNNAVIFSMGTEYEKAQYSALLAAYASGKNVRLYVSGCVAGWGTTYPKLHAVYTY